jgi:phosphomevalonate kinase
LVFFKDYCWQHLAQIVFVAESYLHLDMVVVQQEVVTSLVNVATLLLVRDRHGLVTPAAVVVKLLSSRLLHCVLTFASSEASPSLLTNRLFVLLY